MESSPVRQFMVGTLVLSVLACTQVAFAQVTPGDPRPDVNIVGPTTDPADIRDFGLKQQNEPACAMRPGDGDCIICFYNDYRTVDIFEHQDAWIGMSESCDAGDTWRSRITPGHPTHPEPIGTKFAADPRAIAIPGMTIHGFIGGFRDQDSGVIAVQHWLENNQEDGDYNEPTLFSTIVDEGTEGRFIDKPEFHFRIPEDDPQPPVTLTFEMENPELGTVTRTFPGGTLYAAYAVFTGSQSVKLLIKRSFDLGQTWNNQTKKLTESQNLVSGITMTSLGNMTMAMWRQVQDTNDMDAIYYATTTNGGNSWTKPKLLTEICRFDQPSATETLPDRPLSTFRTNDFPWLANDGNKIYAFFTERVGGCVTGTPKVFMQYTSNGNSWLPNQPRAVDSSPEAAPGAQFMPAAFGARGKVQIAWYDTRRENFLFESDVPYLADYIPEGNTRINRKVDVYTARVTSVGNNVEISPAVRVSQFRTAVNSGDNNPTTQGPPAFTQPFEIEASFANAKMYASGFLAFIGDYIAVTAQEFRENGTGWQENQSAVPNAPNLTNFFIAYADNRDVRGDVYFDGFGNQSQFSPPDNLPAPQQEEQEAATYFDPEDADEKVLLADAATVPPNAESERSSTEGIEDVYVDPAPPCVPEQDRTRDANIYGSVIRDRLRLSTPVASRPLSGILRAIPFIARDVTTEPAPEPPAIAPPKPYRLFIANQPGQIFEANRASFRQVKSVPPFASAPPLSELIEDVEIERNSAVARTIFMVSPDIDASVEVQIYEGSCALATNADDEFGNPTIPTIGFTTACDLLGSITLGGGGTSGTLQQPDYLAQQCQANPADCDVSLTELHNPILENPILENPILENPILENPILENPILENPILENPILENLGYENPILENPILENPILENPILENPILENPILENPILENSAYTGGITYTDMTTVIRNDGNVTTAYNVDQTVANFDSTAGGDPVSQLIVWKQYVTATSRDCALRGEARDQVITTINQPDDILDDASITDPFAGEASLILAPGELGFVTYRLFGTPAELAPVRVSGFTASSQAANCRELNGEVGPQPGEDEFEFYTCEAQLEDNRERIFIERDSEPPTFVPPPGEGDTIPDGGFEANAPGGACVDPAYVAGLLNVTDNESTTIDVSCVDEQLVPICTDPNEAGLSAPVGESPITCTATDELGNEASIGLSFLVKDDLPPFFTSSITEKSANGSDDDGTAIVNLEAGFAGEDQFGVDPNPAISCETDTGLPSGPIPIGVYTVTCTITDASGNTDPVENKTYPLTVLDITAPEFTSTQGDITVNADADGTAMVSFPTPTAIDNSGQPPGVTCDPPSGSIFDPGSTLVTCTATDGTNPATQEFYVVVNDISAPDVFIDGFTAPPFELTIEAGEPFSPPTATAVDNVDGALAATLTSGVVDADTPGEYPLTYSATDDAGNTGTATLFVTVQDTTAPTFPVAPSDIEVPAGADGTATVTFEAPEAIDNSDLPLAVDCTPASGTTFSVGATTVTCTATDGAGLEGQTTFDVIVLDVDPPSIEIVKDPFFALLEDSSGSIVDYSANVSVSDTVDPDPSLSCVPQSGSLFEPGATTVTCTATDNAVPANSTSATFTVKVGYATGIGIFANKYNVRGGSSNPLTWAWQDEFGNNIDSSGDMQMLRIVDCSDPTIVVLDKAGDPGSSGFRFKGDNSWEYNWQTDKALEDGGGPLDPGDYCPSVESELTGDMLLITPRPVTVR